MTLAPTRQAILVRRICRFGAISVGPIRVTDGEAIQSLPTEFPLRHESVHERDEAGVVGRLQQMNQFVENNVFQTLGWLLGELSVEANRACLVVAAPPLGLHPL